MTTAPAPTDGAVAACRHECPHCTQPLQVDRPTEPPASSPWKTAKLAAEYAHTDKDVIYDALHLYVSSGGKRGLRGYQPGGANCKWLIHIDDLDAWIKGQKPGRRHPLRSVS